MNETIPCGDTALYLRLSREDGKDTESDSIASQRYLLEQYAAANGFSVFGIYTDDGISGTIWQRPAFQEMLYAIECGIIRTVITKDLSRLSRDYIRTGELLERWFPSHGVRYIAVSDGIDTARVVPSNDFTPIRAVMDDWYARDISQKVRCALRARQQKGICTLATVPYGYERKNESLEPAASLVPIVEKMFSLALEGYSYREIAAILTENRIPTPGMEKGNRVCSHIWSDKTVRHILCNPAYKGELVLHRTEQISYKCKQKRRLPAEQWCRIVIPPIIDATSFDRIQQLHQRRSPKRHLDWFAGLVYCGECGANMVVCARSPGVRLLCGNRKKEGICRNPTITAAALEQVIAEQLGRDGVPRQMLLWRYVISRIEVGVRRIAIWVRYSELHKNVP